MIYFIYFLIVVAFIDTFSQLPVMSPFADSLGASAIFIGIIVGMYSLTNIAGNMVAGYHIDQKGTKGMLGIGLLLTGLFLCLYAFVVTPTQLLWVRLFHGFTGGLLVPTAFTYLANHSVNERKGKTMALSGAGVGIASILGPAYGGIISASFNVQTVFWTIGVLMIVSAVLEWFILPDYKKSRQDQTEPIVKQKRKVQHLFQRRELQLSYIGAFSLMFSQGILAYELPLKVVNLGFDTSLSGLLMSIFAITSTLIFILPTNRLFDRCSQALTMMVGIGVLAIALFLLEFIITRGLLISVMIFYGVGFALIFPSMNALVASNTDASERGKAYGIFYGFFSLGVVVGSFITGVFVNTVLGAFVVGTIWLFLSLIVLYIIYKKSSINATSYVT